MPLTLNRRNQILIELDKEYQKEHDRHYANAPKNNSIPTGGGDWMDCFFRMESLRGFIGGLRRGKTIDESFEEGRAVGEIAVKLWNTRREWQVHRWEGMPRSYLENVKRLVVQRLKNEKK